MSTVDTAVSLWTLQCLEAYFSLDTAVSTWTLQCPQSNSGYHKTLNNFFPVRDIKFPSSQLIVQYYSWISEMIFFTLAQNFAKNRGHCNIHGGHCSVHADTAVSTADTGRFLHTDKGEIFSLHFWMNWSIWSTFSNFSKFLSKTCRTAELPSPLCRIFYKKYTFNFWNLPLGMLRILGMRVILAMWPI